MKLQNDSRRDFCCKKPGSAVFGFCGIFVSFLIFFLTIQHKTNAQQYTNYTIQANIIYRFTKYIDWPEHKKTGDFIIGIVGDSPLTSELKNFVANKTVGGRRIVVMKFPASSEMYSCHILFISEEMSGSIRKIASQTAGAPILLVTESEGLAVKGSCINFIIVSDRLKLEINKNNIEQRNMEIASELVQLGKVVK